MRYAHTNLIARDWEKLSHFYQQAFNCIPVPPPRDLSGQWIEDLTGIPHVHIVGEHLQLPGYGNAGPTLEIYSYANMLDTENKEVNSNGFSHIAFEVDDVEETLNRVKQYGGSEAGKIVGHDYPGLGKATFVYCRDIEGNIIELQHWIRDQ
jgi:predicted enzyme related to lactoylglutathione lyase